MLKEGFSGSPMVMNLPANARDVGLIPWSGRSSEERNSNSLHYSCLGNPMDRGAWQATFLGVAKEETWLSNWTTKQITFKILQASLQQHMNWELPDVQTGFRKGRGTRDQIANIRWIIGNVREFQKNIYFCFIDYAKAFDCVDHSKLENSKERGTPITLPVSWESRIAGQESTVTTRHEPTNWSKLKWVQ